MKFNFTYRLKNQFDLKFNVSLFRQAILALKIQQSRKFLLHKWHSWLTIRQLT